MIEVANGSAIRSATSDSESASCSTTQVRDASPPVSRDDAAMESEPVTRATGGCDCGGVRYRINGKLRPVVHCHCTPCRRITGHHMAATAAGVDDVHLLADATLTWYQRTPTTRYGFCSTCGATLFWSAADKVDTLSIAAGTLDQPTGLRTVLAIYADEAADYHRLDDALETHSGEQLLN